MPDDNQQQSTSLNDSLATWPTSISTTNSYFPHHHGGTTMANEDPKANEGQQRPTTAILGGEFNFILSLFVTCYLLPTSE
jgi:hypothetical protein